MKIAIEVEVKPFAVPNFVILEAAEQPSIPLTALDASTLDRMCSDFRDAVFQKAGKQQPPRLREAS